MERINLNEGWEFTPTYSLSFIQGKGEGEKIRIPHTFNEIPFNCFDVKKTWLLAAYRLNLPFKKEWKNKRIFITFMGAAHEGEFFLNGNSLYTHRCGYTSFRIELTGKLKEEGENILGLKLDSHESLNQPPFGNVIDYLCYGGLYREVFLEIGEKTIISDAFIYAKDLKTFHIQATIDGALEKEDQLEIKVLDANKEVKGQETILASKDCSLDLEVKDPQLWTLTSPYLYQIVITFKHHEQILDQKTVTNGLRIVKFTKDGFFLNGEKIKLLGLNRHQSYPYVGYAISDSLQREDVRILKEELGVNVVRTSHYPSSQAFLDECDKRGLLVFTEIPGWQHIGDEEWKKIAEQNVEEMIHDGKNHPSIFLWGVRINESQDDDPFYLKTNEIAHRLDPSRPTSGVRFLTKSHLLEDVYAHNDFSYSGQGKRALRKKKVATSDMNKGYFISECNGHMFPTKSFDDEPHRLIHAQRHLKVIDQMFKDDEIAGLFGWCAFDYNTHADFGAGDKICYHGVDDMFRNPKLASYVYASQLSSKPVLSISSSMNKGEYPASSIGEIYALTNADSLKLYKNGEFVKEFFPDHKDYPGLPHPPILIDDFVGDLIIKHEKYPLPVAKDISYVLKCIVKYGQDHLPLKAKLKMVKLMAVNHLTIQEALEIYNKYFGGWGGKALEYSFKGVYQGKEEKTVTLGSADHPRLRLIPSATDLVEGTTYDMALIRIRVEDENGNILSFYQGSLKLESQGPIQIIGPHLISLPGGMFGTLIKTTGQEGKASLSVSGEDGLQGKVDFTIRKEK
ncbi:MAG: glycoside hydrolase family 2 protein [Bacilli bacterium]|jgi:beta-galactosidase|nr:glycoside hydrolase family 2 protein [Bacilli bacterium]